MIRIDNLTKVVGARTLFAIDHLSIGACDKVGLIGDNGTGKTTFYAYFQVLILTTRDEFK